MTEVLKNCMKKAGAFFCRKVELPAEGKKTAVIEVLEDLDFSDMNDSFGV